MQLDLGAIEKAAKLLAEPDDDEGSESDFLDSEVDALEA